VGPGPLPRHATRRSRREGFVLAAWVAHVVYITACTALYRIRVGVRGAGILWE